MVEDKMRISVIIPSYGEVELLPFMLESLKNQRYGGYEASVKKFYENYEAIIVEGSTNSAIDAIAKKYNAIESEGLKAPIRVIHETRQNIGYARNLGASIAEGDILFFTNADCRIEDPYLLFKMDVLFRSYPNLVSLGGVTIEDCNSVFTTLIYTSFHVLRKILSVLPRPLRKFRPTANFLAIRRTVFQQLNGFPEIYVNEDGKFGQKIDRYLQRFQGEATYSKNLKITHVTRRFNINGHMRTLRYYAYVLPNILQLLEQPLQNLTKESEQAFRQRKSVKCSENPTL